MTKKETLRASEQGLRQYLNPDIVVARDAWRDEVMGQVDPDHLVFLDEAGSTPA
ncbi:hypothetical protein [Dankookia sp. P2]|uniref:hypothetical protein n=1 Tax=Dankookia sp. P2 TaxID=3423955 RepID=UPI003D67197C